MKPVDIIETLQCGVSKPRSSFIIASTSIGECAGSSSLKYPIVVYILTYVGIVLYRDTSYSVEA